MKPRLLNLEAMKETLQPYLEQYLQEQGIDTSSNFICINPKHADGDPSMSFNKVDNYAFCFGCGCGVDIFQAAHLLEGKPSKGIGFIEENVTYLADKFGIQLKLQDLTPEEIYEYRTYSAYKLAAQLVADPEFGDYSKVDTEVKARGWDKKKIEGWGVGTVNYDEYKSRMKAAGFEPGFLSGIDLDRSNLFDNHNMLFTVYDDFGRPVGFSAKNLRHNKNDKQSGPKYINTRQTGLECAIFKKGQRLYGLEIAKDVSGPLYIFEGQADVITARHYGLMNCCCTLGTALTDPHINLLKQHGIFNLILVFDGDAAGEAAIERIVDEKFSKEKDFRVKLIQLPEGLDPDDLLRTKGIDEFVRLKKWSAFEWRMMKFMDKKEDEEEDEDRRREIAEKMAPIIVSEPSHIRQEEMAKQVARMTGYDQTTILSEVKRLRNEKEAAIQARKKNAIEALLQEVKFNPDEAEVALAQAQTALDDINKSVQDDSSGSSTLSMVLSQKESDENKSDEFAGFFMDPKGLGGIAARMNDDWRKDHLVFIGGSEQSGKTTFCCQMAYEIANDERNNAICIYHSIDDAARFPLYKWVCRATDATKLHLNHVSSPNYWEKQDGMDYIKDAREQGYRKIIQLIKDERLVIKDSSDGQSISYSEMLIKYYREKYPDRNIVLFLDNFHKLPDYGNINGHERVKRLSNHLKNLTTAHHITIVSTVEYRKMMANEMPSNVAIAESRSLQYDATVIMHLYNNMHVVGEEQAILVHQDEDGNLLPRIWVKFGKNKVSGFEGREFIDLFGYAGQARAVDPKTAEEDQRIRVQFLKENQTNEY